MLYDKQKHIEKDEKFFENPPAIYRAAPFWAWNGKLDERVLGEEIGAFREMALGGFFMHVRFGLEDQYLGEKFLQSVEYCVKEAEKNQMFAWLYDEDRWPSGCAGGLVTKNPAYRRKTMTFESEIPQNFAISSGEKEEDYISLRPLVAAAYAVKKDEKGALLSYRRISLPLCEEFSALAEKDESAAQDYVYGQLNAGESAYFAVIRCDASSDWYNGASYSDDLNENAIAEFIRVTHETYLARIGEKFGKSVPGIFSDEPNIEPYEKFEERGVPWSIDFPAKFKEAYGEDIFARLPELYALRSPQAFAAPDRENGVKKDFIYRYYAFISERFAAAYSEKIGAWCKKHNLAFTGHYLCEDSLEGQTACSGNVMRQYAGYALPGIDMLCDEREYITAAQVKSVANQTGKEGVMCELYGSTNWDFDFRGFKLQGDWLAAMGVTLRVPHLAWYTMKGEGKRDYPASIGIQANWYKKFSLIEDHFARVNACLTRGVEIVNVAVIHPIESAWTATKEESARLTKELIGLSETLYKNGVNFDFIDESMLPSLWKKEFPKAVSESEYKAIVIPRLTSLRQSTAEFLEAFVAGGGKLVSLTDAILYSGGEELKKAESAWLFKRVFSLAMHVNTAEEAASALQETAFMRILPHKNETGELIYRAVRERDTERIFLFICRADKQGEEYTPGGFDFEISGEYKARLFDTQSGKIFDFPCSAINGKTHFSRIFEAQDSLLLALVPVKNGVGNCVRKVNSAQDAPETAPESGELPAAYAAETDEYNVLLIDRASAYIGGVETCGEEETLRLDKKMREKIGMPPRDFFSAQPWTHAGAEEKIFPIVLEYRFKSEIRVQNAYLAAELADVTEIEFNGEAIPMNVAGKYVDDAISKIALPEISRGENSLRLHVNYHSQSSVENVMILGDFFAEKQKIENGEKGVIAAKKAGLPWGRIDDLGYAFYGGNLTYVTKINVKHGGWLAIKAPCYKGNLIEIAVDGQKKGKILYAPYKADLGKISAGAHELRLTLYGNRFNTFGQLHNTTAVPWDGTYAWRTDGKEWSYDLLTRPVGIMSAPTYEIYAAENSTERGGKEEK